MKLVKESLGFKREGDPAKTLQVGKFSDSVGRRDRENFIDLLDSVGIAGEWYNPDKAPSLYVLKRHYKKTERYSNGPLGKLGGAIDIYYTWDLDLVKKNCWDPNPKITGSSGPWVLVTNAEYKSRQKIFLTSDPILLLKEMLLIEYKESNQWGYLKSMANTLKILGYQEKN